MRIVLTIHHELSENSGAPGSTLAYASALKALGHTVQVVSYDNFGLTDHKPSSLLKFWSVLPGYLKTLKGQPDVISFSGGDMCFCRVKHRSRPLLVTHSHGLEHLNDLAYRKEIRRKNERLRIKYQLFHGGLVLWAVASSIKESDLSLFLNTSEQEFAIRELGVLRDKTRCSPNGIAPILMQRRLPARRVDGRFRVAIVGSFIERKGSAYYLPAIAQLLSKCADIEVFLLGTGCAPEEVLGNFPEHMRSSINVRTRYSREELPGLLDGSDVLLFPSLAEGFGVALVEGMACGLVPIATDLGGPRDILAQEGTGIKIRPRRVDDIVSAVLRLKNNPDELAAMRRQAWERSRLYSWMSIAEQRLRYYKEAMERR